MTRLAEKTPGAGLFPIARGDVRISEVSVGHITSIAPYKGQHAACSEALQAAHGMGFPPPNRSTGKAGARAIWFGLRMAVLMGPAPDDALAQHAALTDQSDAWTVVRLEGAGAQDVLARLTPLDLRAGVFKQGHTARSELAHMAASITKVGANAWQIMVFRAFAQTLAHELRIAAQAVAARARLGQGDAD
ncbi:sarcosine oxidase subunit gamma [Rhodobacteraceae bacterium KMM 6894]|nr:sarcosine oxidase subunit gamma [Rhodobacteraceae bacterium KMM 6894]